jgi:uncharacterized membrane protein YidH (DUF202 family)
MSDQSAARERTRLAWRRTGLSAAVVGLLAVRPALHPDAGPGRILLAALAMAGWSAMVAVAYRRAGRLNRPVPATARGAVLGYAALTVGIAVIGGLVVTL